MKYRVSFFNMKNENENNGVILTSDEINYIEYYYVQNHDMEYKQNYANRNSQIKLKISGKLISHIDNEDKNNDEFNYNSLFSNNKSQVLKGPISKLDTNYINSFKGINNKIFKEIENINENNFYKQNKENIKFINEFAFQYKKENDYMDIVVEIDLGNNEMQVLLFKNMYAEKFYQSFSTNKGSSTFVLDLKQKYYENAKVEIH